MNKYTQLKQDLKQAQLNKEADKVGSIRYIISRLQNEAIEGKVKPEEMDDEKIEEVLVKIGKEREESIDAFKKGGRDELVKKEKAELEILNHYMPKKMTEEETIAAVEEVINELNAKSMQQMGDVMSEVKKRYGAQIDMGKASKTAKETLGVGS